jgi:glyoxylase-like metal-dependent hydrolase (beta-lactamase superfamily II)
MVGPRPIELKRRAYTLSKAKMREIVEGVIQFEVPMRLNPLNYTYSYLLKDASTLIDTGVPSDQSYVAFKKQLRKVGFNVKDIERIIITHLHRDHVGLLDFIKEESSAKVLASDEAVKVQEMWQKIRNMEYDNAVKEAKLWGGGELLKILVRYELFFKRPRPIIGIDRPIEDGESLSLDDYQLKTFWTPGHSREHICLYDFSRRILFSGDHVLPGITSHISLHTYQDFDPLKDYLLSLEKIRGLSVNTVLPGHESVFGDLDGRIDELKKHHELRCKEIIRALEMGGETVFDVASKISWDSKPWPLMNFWNRGMAAAETYAHLVYLKNKRKVTEENREDVLVYTTA